MFHTRSNHHTNRRRHRATHRTTTNVRSLNPQTTTATPLPSHHTEIPSSQRLPTQDILLCGFSIPDDPIGITNTNKNNSHSRSNNHLPCQHSDQKSRQNTVFTNNRALTAAHSHNQHQNYHSYSLLTGTLTQSHRSLFTKNTLSSFQSYHRINDLNRHKNHLLTPHHISKRSIHRWEPEHKSFHEVAKHSEEKIAPNRGDTVGIKLGSSNLSISYIADGGVVYPVKHRDESVQTPAVVSLTADGYTLFGRAAVDNQLSNPVGTLYDFLKYIGRKSFDATTIKDQELVPYELGIVNGEVGFKLWGKKLSVDNIITLLISPMRHIINHNVYHVVDQCVLTVPVTFTQEQRDKYESYWTKAGFVVQDVILEPIAAAMAYGTRRAPGQKIAVWDMGGSNFNFSLLEVRRDGSLHIKSTKGTKYLGGVDFDSILTDLLFTEIQLELGLDLRRNELAMNRIKLASKEAREKLSTQNHVDIDLPFIHLDQYGPKHFKTKLHRDKWNETALPYLWRTIQYMNHAFEESEWNVQDVNEVIMAGGMSRWQLPKTILTEYFRPPPLKYISSLTEEQQQSLNAGRVIPIKDHLPVDEVFSIGAANHGGNLKLRRDKFDQMTLNPMGLGFCVNGNGEYIRVVNAQRSLPVIANSTITPSFWDQNNLSIDIYQGDHLITKYNRYLGSILLDIKNPGPPRGRKFNVQMSVDKMGNLAVVVMDLKSREEWGDTFGSVHLHGFNETELNDQLELAVLMNPSEKEELDKIQAYDKAQITYHHLSLEYTKLFHLMSSDQASKISKNLAHLYETLKDPTNKTSHDIITDETNCYQKFLDMQDMWFTNTQSKAELQWPKSLIRHPDRDFFHQESQLSPHYRPDYSWYTYKYKKPLRSGLTQPQLTFLDKLTKSGKFAPDAYKAELDFRMHNVEGNWHNDHKKWTPLNQALKEPKDKPRYYSKFWQAPTERTKGYHPDFDGKLPQALQNRIDKYERQFSRKLRKREQRLIRRAKDIEEGIPEHMLSELSEIEGGEFIPEEQAKTLQDTGLAKQLLKAQRKQEKKNKERKATRRERREARGEEFESDIDGDSDEEVTMEKTREPLDELKKVSPDDDVEAVLDKVEKMFKSTEANILGKNHTTINADNIIDDDDLPDDVYRGDKPKQQKRGGDEPEEKGKLYRKTDPKKKFSYTDPDHLKNPPPGKASKSSKPTKDPLADAVVGAAATVWENESIREQQANPEIAKKMVNEFITFRKTQKLQRKIQKMLEEASKKRKGNSKDQISLILREKLNKTLDIDAVSTDIEDQDTISRGALTADEEALLTLYRLKGEMGEEIHNREKYRLIKPIKKSRNQQLSEDEDDKKKSMEEKRRKKEYLRQVRRQQGLPSDDPDDDEDSDGDDDGEDDGDNDDGDEEEDYDGADDDEEDYQDGGDDNDMDVPDDPDDPAYQFLHQYRQQQQSLRQRRGNHTAETQTAGPSDQNDDDNYDTHGHEGHDTTSNQSK